MRIVFVLLLAATFAEGAVVAGTVDENKALVSRFIAAENANDYENLPTYITEDFARHSEATPNMAVASRDQFVAHMRDNDAFFTGVKYYPRQVIAEGDRVAVWASYRGRTGDAVAGKPKVDVDVSMIFRVEGDEIAELWTMWDNNALRTQLEAKAH